MLDENIIDISLKGDSKVEVLESLSNLLLENKYIENTEEFVFDILEREKLGQTGIGNYIAIPHGISDTVSKNGIAIGKLEKEIPWETLDGKGVKLIFLFCVQSGDNRNETHLKMLAKLAGALGNDEIVGKLLEAETGDDIITAFKDRF